MVPDTLRRIPQPETKLGGTAIQPRRHVGFEDRAPPSRWRRARDGWRVVGDAAVAPGPKTGCGMKRGNQSSRGATQGAGTTKARPAALDGDVVDDDRDAGRDGDSAPPDGAGDGADGAFDARAIRDSQGGADRSQGLWRHDPTQRVTSDRPAGGFDDLRAGAAREFPQRFYLTARCVVWDLAEVMAWLQSRRQAGSNGVKKAPMPDVRRRTGASLSAIAQLTGPTTIVALAAPGQRAGEGPVGTGRCRNLFHPRVEFSHSYRRRFDEMVIPRWLLASP